MFTSRLLGCRYQVKQFTRNINFFRSRKDPPAEEINVIDEIEPVEEKPKQIVIPKRELPFLNPHLPKRQAWVENMDTTERNLLGLIDLHPEVFGYTPRVDLIHENIIWQTKYKYVRWAHGPVRLEVNKSNRKPWPQKGTGRARHGTRKSHIFKGGAVCHPPRGPETHFYMLPMSKRLLGLCATLSVKLAQDDIHIIDRLEIPTGTSEYLLGLAEQRNWGASVLFVDVPDILTRNMAMALDSVKHFNAMPVYGLNCYSMLKYETLVLTLDAVDEIEKKLLQHLHGIHTKQKKFDESVLHH